MNDYLVTKVFATKNNIHYACELRSHAPVKCGCCRHGIVGRPGLWRSRCRVCGAVFTVQTEHPRRRSVWAGSIGA